MKNKIIPKLLIFLLLFIVLTACSSSDNDSSLNGDNTSDPLDSSGTVSGTPGGNDHFPSSGIDFDSAFTAFAPDTIMLKTSSGTLTWAELFVFLHRTVSDLFHSFGDSFDWAEGTDDGHSLSELVL